MRITAGKAE